MDLKGPQVPQGPQLISMVLWVPSGSQGSLRSPVDLKGPQGPQWISKDPPQISRVLKIAYGCKGYSGSPTDLKDPQDPHKNLKRPQNPSLKFILICCLDKIVHVVRLQKSSSIFNDNDVLDIIFKKQTANSIMEDYRERYGLWRVGIGIPPPDLQIPGTSQGCNQLTHILNERGFFTLFYFSQLYLGQILLGSRASRRSGIR